MTQELYVVVCDKIGWRSHPQSYRDAERVARILSANALCQHPHTIVPENRMAGPDLETDETLKGNVR